MYLANINLPSRYKREESKLLSEEKGPHHLGQLVVWVLHLYVFINLLKWYKTCLSWSLDLRSGIDLYIKL